MLDSLFEITSRAMDILQGLGHTLFPTLGGGVAVGAVGEKRRAIDQPSYIGKILAAIAVQMVTATVAVLVGSYVATKILEVRITNLEQTVIDSRREFREDIETLRGLHMQQQQQRSQPPERVH